MTLLCAPASDPPTRAPQRRAGLGSAEGMALLPDPDDVQDGQVPGEAVGHVDDGQLPDGRGPDVLALRIMRRSTGASPTGSAPRCPGRREPSPWPGREARRASSRPGGTDALPTADQSPAATEDVVQVHEAGLVAAGVHEGVDGGAAATRNCQVRTTSCKGVRLKESRASSSALAQSRSNSKHPRLRTAVGAQQGTEFGRCPGRGRVRRDGYVVSGLSAHRLLQAGRTATVAAAAVEGGGVQPSRRR